MSDINIVTAASSNHFNCLKNLLYSIDLFEPTCRATIYDIGLSNEERYHLSETRHRLCRFPFERYPSYLDINVACGQYAWKPVIIADELSRTNGILLWMDAGNLVRAPLAKLRLLLSHSGVWSMTSAGTVERWTHPGTLAYLHASHDMLSKPSRSAGLVAFKNGHPGINELVERWKNCALDQACIAPAGSNRLNHRQDQAVLTVLLYQYQEIYGVELEHRRMDITMHHDSLSFDEASRLLTSLVEKSSQPTVH